jgi:hypothetical protein
LPEEFPDDCPKLDLPGDGDPLLVPPEDDVPLLDPPDDEDVVPLLV